LSFAVLPIRDFRTVSVQKEFNRKPLLQIFVFWEFLARPAGIEPATPAFGVEASSRHFLAPSDTVASKVVDFARLGSP
jgi:hypothetical protein